MAQARPTPMMAPIVAVCAPTKNEPLKPAIPGKDLKRDFSPLGLFVRRSGSSVSLHCDVCVCSARMVSQDNFTWAKWARPRTGSHLHLGSNGNRC